MAHAAAMRRRTPLPHPRCKATHLTTWDALDVPPPPGADDDGPPPLPVERLILQPGDTVVLRMPAWATQYDQAQTRDRAREQLPAAVGIVVVAGDELAVIRPDTRHLEVQLADEPELPEWERRLLEEQQADPDPLLTEPGVPRRAIAIQLARAHEEIRIALNGTPERERIPWEDMPASYRARLANVLEEMIAQGLIKP